jgi:hypothetical protein
MPKIKFYDSNDHEIKWSFEPTKGNVFTRLRYFGEFHHLDGSVACDGNFRQEEVKYEQ